MKKIQSKKVTVGKLEVGNKIVLNSDPKSTQTKPIAQITHLITFTPERLDEFKHRNVVEIHYFVVAGKDLNKPFTMLKYSTDILEILSDPEKQKPFSFLSRGFL